MVVQFLCLLLFLTSSSTNDLKMATCASAGYFMTGTLETEIPGALSTAELSWGFPTFNLLSGNVKSFTLSVSDHQSKNLSIFKAKLETISYPAKDAIFDPLSYLEKMIAVKQGDYFKYIKMLDNLNREIGKLSATQRNELNDVLESFE